MQTGVCQVPEALTRLLRLGGAGDLSSRVGAVSRVALEAYLFKGETLWRVAETLLEEA